MAYEFETRPGGGDIRPATPAPAFQEDGAEYAYAPAQTGRAEDSRDRDGGGSGGALSVVAWCVFALVSLWMFTAASPFLANALSQSGWRSWVSLALGCLPVLCVTALFSYAAAVFRRMPRFEQLSATSFTNKAELQRRLASSYVGKFPDPERYAADNWPADGDGGGARAEAAECLRRLQADAADCRGWLAEFDRLLALQDERAVEIVRRAWQLVAVKTAASPWKIIDMLSVICNSTVMVTRLARLYNRRTSRHAAFRLVCRWFVNICIAGEMGDAAQGTVEWASANDLISSTYKPLAGIVGRVAEGGANAFLVYRLGIRARAYFRPLTP